MVAYQGDFVYTQGYDTVMIERTDRKPGDIDGDGSVDLLDFATFAVCYGFPVTAPPRDCSPDAADASDLDRDGQINLVDFATFALVFGT